VVLVAGQRADADALWDEVGAVLAPMCLRLSAEKSRVCHIDEGIDFLVPEGIIGPGRPSLDVVLLDGTDVRAGTASRAPAIQRDWWYLPHGRRKAHYYDETDIADHGRRGRRPHRPPGARSGHSRR